MPAAGSGSGRAAKSKAKAAAKSKKRNSVGASDVGASTLFQLRDTILFEEVKAEKVGLFFVLLVLLVAAGGSCMGKNRFSCYLIFAH